MAPPIPGLRRAVVGRRRTVGDIAAGILAVIALAILTVGVPAALVTVLGLPIPHSKPTLSLLTHQLSILSIVRILSIVVWLAWIQLVLCVFAEVRAAVRNVGVPVRIPLSGGTQALAHRLVTAALLLATGTAALSPAFSPGGPPPRAPHTISAVIPSGTPVQAVLTAHETVAVEPVQAVSAPDPHVEKIYIVKPPVGRFHESLWEIAENHLGNGLRYREIFEMNKDRPQPDGTMLTMASLIRPGWVLRMPRDASGPGIKIVAPGVPGGPAGAAEQAGASQAIRATEAATGVLGVPSGSVQGSGTRVSGPAGAEKAGANQVTQVGKAATSAPRSAAGSIPGAIPGAAGLPGSPGVPGSPALPGSAGLPASPALPGATAPPGAAGAERAGVNQAGQVSQAATGSHGSAHGSGAPGSGHHTPLAPGHGQPARPRLPLPRELSAATLLSAGVLAAVGRRRREQLWRRAFGHRLVMPEGPAAMAEAALRLGAHEPSVRLLDTCLRSLSQELAALGKSLPTVFAAHLGQVNLDLWIAPADPHPPRPWLAVDDGQVWRLPIAAVAHLDPDEAGAALAPYPGLVSIGTNDNGRMLVDLEVAHGVIAVRGSHRMVQSVLAAMAVELATSRWSDRMCITLVGFGPELSVLAPDRIMAADTIEEVLPALEARAAEIEHALAALGTDTVLTGRCQGVHPDSWAPHYLISAVPPTPHQRERLVTLAAARNRLAMGYVVAGDVDGATWTWDVSEQGRLHAGALGFDLRAQLLPPDQYAAVVELFRAASELDGVPLGDPQPDAAPPAQLVPGTRLPVEVTVLGRVSVQAPGGIEPDRVGVATEIVSYLAAHPEGVHPDDLTDAIWPRGVAPEVRNVALARVRDWLGVDDSGQPNLTASASGLMRLGPQVRVDWQVFRSLVGWADKARLEAIGDKTYRDRPGDALLGAPVPGGNPQSGTGHGGHAAPAGPDEAAYLSRALDLVQGQLLDGHDPGRYTWLAGDPLEYEATAWVADAAHRLAELCLIAGDPQGAMDAIRAGLRLAFNDELLWRDLLVAAHSTGHEHVLRAVVGEVSARVSLDEVLPRMAPETEALIDELLPSWRQSVA